MNDEKAVGKRYEGHSGVARESQWLTAEDLQARNLNELAVKIEDVQIFRNVKFEQGRGKDVAIGLKFVKMPRTLLLNRTNTKVLNKMFGKIAKAWFGQTVTLFVTQTKVSGETVDCLRIRDRGSRVATAAEDLLHDDEPSEPTTKPGHGKDEDPDKAAFESAAAFQGLSNAERDELLAENDGNYKRAHDELAKRAGVDAGKLL